MVLGVSGCSCDLSSLCKTWPNYQTAQCIFTSCQVAHHKPFIHLLPDRPLSHILEPIGATPDKKRMREFDRTVHIVVRTERYPALVTAPSLTQSTSSSPAAAWPPDQTIDSCPGGQSSHKLFPFDLALQLSE